MTGLVGILDPCGRPCDWMRSAYETTMLFEEGGAPFPVRWYRADMAQPWAPDGNLFVSSNWVNRDLVGGELGEQPGGKPWRNGADFRGYPVQTGDPCLLDVLLQTGLSTGETTGPWSEGRLICCNGCCPDKGVSLFARVSPGSGCPCLDNTEVELTWSAGSNSWKGSATVCSSELFEVEFICDGPTCEDTRLNLSFENHGVVGPSLPDSGCGCRPLSATFSNLDFPIQGSECDGAIQVIVSAS